MGIKDYGYGGIRYYFDKVCKLLKLCPIQYEDAPKVATAYDLYSLRKAKACHEYEDNV
jgi:hypothetical protein